MLNASSGRNAIPTVALVHGAFADSSGWEGVIKHLLTAEVPVRALLNPLRGLAVDSAYVASAIQQIPGPVLAVGHSYGGGVVNNPAARGGKGGGLVFNSGFGPGRGESPSGIEEGSKDSVLSTALLTLHYPTGDGSKQGVEFAINPASFHDAFAADLPRDQAAIMAATQRPVSTLAFTEQSGPPAWKTLPSWGLVPTGDKAAGSDVLRSMAQRAGAVLAEVEGSHVIMMSQPQAVADLILQAIKLLKVRTTST